MRKKTDREWLRYLELAEERPEAFVPDGPLKIVMDEDTVEAFERRNGRKIGVVYESRYNILVVDLVEDRNGRRFAYERLLPAVKSRAVVVIPVLDGKLILLDQYRHAPRKKQYAFPRGFAEEGMSPERNAVKELREELGAEVKTCTQIGNLAADSGISGSEAAVFLCRLEHTDPCLHHEGIEGALPVTEAEFRDMVSCGKIDDGFTLAAFCLYEARK